MPAPFRVDDFSGGKTDHYVNGPINRGKEFDNLLITRNRKPKQRPGSKIYDMFDPQIPAGNQRISKLKWHEDSLFAASARQISVKEEDGSAWVALVGPGENNPALSAGDVSNIACMDSWQGHLYSVSDEYSNPSKMYKDGSGDWQVRTAGLPRLSTDPVITANGTDSSVYKYVFHYSYEYYVGTTKYLDYGPTLELQVEGCETITGSSPNLITAIPELTNGLTGLYDTTAIKVRIYRTEDGGVVSKFIGEITNGTTTFDDGVEDSALGVTLYTNGGVYDNDPPPLCKYFLVAGNFGYYLNCKEGTEEKPFRVRQSIGSDIDSCPESFYIDVDGEITGGSSIDIYPVVFTETKTHRLESTIDSFGRGDITVRVVDDRVGCISNEGIVRYGKLLVFPAKDGFYATDGFKVTKLSEHLNDTYQNATRTADQRRKISGTLDKVTNRVYWTMQSSEESDDTDIIIVLDPYWGMSVESTFTTFSGGTSIRPTSLEMIDGDLIRADSRGYVFKHDDELFTDPVIDVSTVPSLWKTQAVVYDYTSCAMSFGTEVLRKYVTKVVTIFKNLTNLSTQIISINDDSGIEKGLKAIRFRGNAVWDDPGLIWSDSDLNWNTGGLIMNKRLMPRKGLRCYYKQIKMTNADIVINKSDDFSTATVNAADSTVLMDDVSETWPLDIEGQKIYFDDDGYTFGFTIVSRTDDTLTLSDVSGQLSVGSKKWEIQGIRKDEIFELESYSLNYELMGESHTSFATGDGGGNE